MFFRIDKSSNRINCYFLKGTEFSHVTGYNPDKFSQRMYIDYDPVTGRGLRTAHRIQVTIIPDSDQCPPTSSCKKVIISIISGSPTVGGKCFVP